MPEEDQNQQDQTFVDLFRQHLSARKELPAAGEEMDKAHADTRAEMELEDTSVEVSSRQVNALQHFRACKRRVDELRSTIHRTNREAQELDIEIWQAFPVFKQDVD